MIIKMMVQMQHQLAYLQAELKEPLYVYPPKGLMSEHGRDPHRMWELHRALYGWLVSGRI